MRVLLVGGGGREHALAWKLARDDSSIDLVAAPGNPGVAEFGRCAPVNVGDSAGLLALAREYASELIIIGPEAPLASGLSDLLRKHGFNVFGPSASAARIESDKAFAKDLMLSSGVPTARAERHSTVASAKAAVRQFGAPVVIKATGLAAGKGVVVCDTIDEAERAVEAMLLKRILGAAGASVLVEEYMEGEELSIFALTDGFTFLTMLPAQDHKRLGVGDAGPNTGGMGAYAPVGIGSAEVVATVSDKVFSPILAAMREVGAPFSGLLYAGVMLTSDGPRVVEFNCRFGDPETQALLPLLESSLLDPMVAVARGEGLQGASAFVWTPAHAVTTVLAARGYPESPKTGDPITLPTVGPGVQVFHAGTRRDDDGRLVTAGGRVFAVTGTASTFAEAQRRSRTAADRIDFLGKQFRSDIGWREAGRGAGAS